MRRSTTTSRNHHQHALVEVSSPSSYAEIRALERKLAMLRNKNAKTLDECADEAALKSELRGSMRECAALEKEITETEDMLNDVRTRNDEIVESLRRHATKFSDEGNLLKKISVLESVMRRLRARQRTYRRV